jgi:hypothetical protein
MVYECFGEESREKTFLYSSSISAGDIEYIYDHLHINIHA